MKPTRLDPKLAIAHYIPAVRLEEAGVVRMALDLCSAMATRGHNVTLITSDGTDVPTSWASTDSEGHVPRVPRVVAVRRGFLGLLGRGSKAPVARVLHDADVLHLHGPWSLANLQLARWAKTQGLPYVVSVHGMLNEWSMRQKPAKKRMFLMCGGRQFLEKAACIHCTAEEERHQSQRWYPRGSAAVVQCVCDIEQYLTRPTDQRGAAGNAETSRTRRPRLLFLSRVHPQKGVELLIRAVAKLRDSGVDVDLIVAGPGEKDYIGSLQALSDNLGVRGKVEFPGMIRDIDQKIALYRSCDVFILPTSQENFGIVLIEAMACGLPVITTRGVAIWRELTEGGATIVERSPMSLSGAILELLNDPADRAARGLRGQEWVRGYTDVEHVVEQFENMYVEVRGRSRRR